ncbi:DNA-(apurinic or apyrimidinic site) endonuclease 2-like [Salvia splendens]|uniref:DNA-(apurinic or apyrimidinic site) endonuclease 2-like n=1 Tax=Salvia splendens TaxID=180675 RepID=UPI001C26ACBA|nr:DNA-(apurinic or apyrimidinic site) endonuclease 2-like [Salvia splendens]
MKIVTYNVNGLRPRISQFGSLRKLLDSFDADIICFQETKLSRQEFRADLVQAEGYESFFSCTRTTEKGRTGYSGVATFCHVNSVFSSDEVSLPVSAEEGFTGVLKDFSVSGYRKIEYSPLIEGLEDFSAEELLKIDGEGRCIITDHEHFVLFNIYGPRAVADDTERIQFKHNFFNILQKRWESLLHQGRRIFVVGDLNISPFAIDCCDAGPDFEKNKFKSWFRSLLVNNGGAFFYVFREKHPQRREAYTCWPTNSGAEEFNFGTRIDHILGAGPCLHKEETQGHSLIACHVKECDILDQFKRWKPGSTPRHKEQKTRNGKMEGSDHAPVYVSLIDIPNAQPHNTPSLSTRYCPQVYGCQQTLVSMFARRQSAEDSNLSGGSNSISDDSNVLEKCSQLNKRTLHSCSSASSDFIHQGILCTSDDSCSDSFTEPSSGAQTFSASGHTKSSVVCKKKARKSQSSQLSLKSFFQKTVGGRSESTSFCSNKELTQEDFSIGEPSETFIEGCEHNEVKELQEKATKQCGSVQEDMSQSAEKKNNNALVEWQRIQQLMQTSIPLCKGHKEPCVSRVVKKPGPTLGQRFYACARAEGPASNPEANCGFFKWATAKSKKKR